METALSRIQIDVLRALSIFSAPVSALTLLNTTALSNQIEASVYEALAELEERELAMEYIDDHPHEWLITGIGRNAVESIEPERDSTDDEIADFIRKHAPKISKALGTDASGPLHASVCDVPEPPREAPTALCCIDEDELDAWWDEQDVEVKADAFLRWALDRTTGYIYVGETERRIPIVGTIGEAVRGAVSQPDGFAGQTAR